MKARKKRDGPLTWSAERTRFPEARCAPMLSTMQLTGGALAASSPAPGGGGCSEGDGSGSPSAGAPCGEAACTTSHRRSVRALNLAPMDSASSLKLAINWAAFCQVSTRLATPPAAWGQSAGQAGQ